MSTASSSTSATPAPWRAALLNDIGKMSQATFTLSTLHHTQGSSSSLSGGSPVPRARTCIYRGMWAELPEDARNPADRNPPLYASDLLTFTTDRRMHKAADVLSPGGLGGGPVEACFWAAEAQAQWRVRGRAWVLSAAGADGPGAAEARRAVRERMRPSSSSSSSSSSAAADPERGQDQDQDDLSWSWSREVKAHFGNLSPMMRGTFRNPPPGTPRAVAPEQGLGLGQQVDGVEDALALGNFRVCVIVPDEVELVDLSDAADPRRLVRTVAHVMLHFTGLGDLARFSGGTRRDDGTRSCGGRGRADDLQVASREIPRGVSKAWVGVLAGDGDGGGGGGGGGGHQSQSTGSPDGPVKPAKVTGTAGREVVGLGWKRNVAVAHHTRMLAVTEGAHPSV
ncbi:uncharacterized protein E0L32_011116 [Thyridium curvatum]|uniref:Pyridoxamine 5'-phosphate oxidase Alr4036 family FMN-binding domain-containing protein n=1 Tax=Thyridium curvatum TaxID=1093900 RepID=A0A507AQ53_9PEZI|nr:uncharacterized protein E0L32_011116 [Thyridium curvatum]TPX06971.1 hypothetical protein E0L32_011116 [Thyridium curvatum]